MQIARRPGAAVAETLRLLRLAESRSLADQLDDEADSVVRLSQTADGLEGVAAFLERRPVFSSLQAMSCHREQV